MYMVFTAADVSHIPIEFIGKYKTHYSSICTQMRKTLLTYHNKKKACFGRNITMWFII